MIEVSYELQQWSEPHKKWRFMTSKNSRQSLIDLAESMLAASAFKLEKRKLRILECVQEVIFQKEVLTQAKVTDRLEKKDAKPSNT